MLERSGVDLCLSNPGFAIDIDVAADLAAMAKVWLGDTTFSEALRTRTIVLSGTAELTRRFPSWLLLSPFAGVPRPATAPLSAR